MHTGSGGFAARRCIEYWEGEIGPGDVFILNDPFFSLGSHLPDYTFIMPVHVQEELIGFSCARAHQIDIGGGYFGSYNANAREIFEEGLRLPPMRLIEAGKRRQDVWDLLMLGTRVPETMAGDLQAMIGACRIGGDRLESLCGQYGLEGLRAAARGILDYGERMMRARIEEIPDGVYRAEEIMNNDCFSRTDVAVRVAITVTGSDVVVDFEGSDPQVPGFKNSPYVNTCAAAYLGLRTVVDPLAPMNEGAYRMIEVKAPPGCVVNAQPPAAVTMCTAHPAHEIVHVCWRALAPALPRQTSAGWGRASFPLTSGEDQRGNRYAMYHWGAMGGAGATAQRDGPPQVGLLVSMANLRVPSLEMAEQQYPVEFRRHELRGDGGGAGEHRGGTGVHYEVEVKRPGTWSFRCEGLYTPSGFGLEGGAYGGEGVLRVRDLGSGQIIDTPQYGLRDLPPVVLELDSPGGGGWGHPFDRDPQRVCRDVRDELVSVQSAAADYGVVVCGSPPRVDQAATAALRRVREEA
jgi:N-methylhydantoinase B